MDAFKEGEDMVGGVVFGILIKIVGAKWGGEKRARGGLGWDKSEVVLVKTIATRNVFGVV